MTGLGSESAKDLVQDMRYGFRRVFLQRQADELPGHTHITQGAVACLSPQPVPLNQRIEPMAPILGVKAAPRPPARR